MNLLVRRRVIMILSGMAMMILIHQSDFEVDCFNRDDDEEEVDVKRDKKHSLNSPFD